MHEISKRTQRPRLLRATDLWAVGLPATVAAVLFALLLAKIIIHFFGRPPDFTDVLSTFRGTLSPKPQQQLRYIFILILWPLFMAAALFFIKYKKRRVSRRFITASQISLIVFVLFNITYQESFVHAYFATKSPVMVYSVLAFIGGLALTYLVLFSDASRFRKWGFTDRMAVGIALGVSLLQLMVCIITDQNYLGSALGVFTHLPFTFDEFAAVANGRTISVDYFPQYQQMLPYVLSPIFHFFGLSITTYTVALALLSGVILGFVYAILRNVCERPEVVLLLFLSWLGIAFFPIETNGAARYLTFTYFPIGPFRLLGFWSVAYFSIRTATGNLTFKKQVLCFFWASLVTLNTFDFGVPGLIGCLLVMILFSKNWKQTGFAFFSGFIGASLIYVSIPLIRTGKFPDLSAALSYLSAAGRVGYTALHTPTWGDHWIFLLALLTALSVGATRWWNERIHPVADIREKSLTAAYIFFGIAGSGAFAYFMNRSHWHVLVVIAPIAFFPFLLFTSALFSGEGPNPIFYRLNQIPRVGFFVITACGLGLLKNIPNPVAQWERINFSDSSFFTQEEGFASRVRNRARTGESVAISYPFGQLIASRANVVNVFPYPQAGSMLLRSQVDLAIQAIEENQVQTLFGEFPLEFFPWMEKSGFKEVDRLGNFGIFRRGLREFK